MYILGNLILLGIILYLFIGLFLEDFDNRSNAISYKIYIFLFIFILYFKFQIFNNLVYYKTINFSKIIEVSINNAILAIIAFDIFNDLSYNKFFDTFSREQKILVLILLIIGFMATIKILELMISSD